MSVQTNLPRAAQPFVEFPQILRSHGFAVSPDQTISFLEAIGLLGPRDVEQVRNAGIAMMAIPRERWGEYDALFRGYFLGQTIAAPATTEEDEDETEAYEEQDGQTDVDVTEEEQEIGGEASVTEALARRTFAPLSDDDVLTHFRHHANQQLPRRRSHRFTSARQGSAFDMRRMLREAVKRDGEVFDLAQIKRKTRLRPIVMLVDVSGSMEAQSEQTLRVAHALKMAADRVEVFTFGTRLTRITRALADKNVERALERVGALVADFDGGTRIGDALAALLAVPRFAGTLRGASVVILSDGLERGEPHQMVDAVQRMSRMAWRLDWLSPLAADKSYVARTEALSLALPFLDTLADGSGVEPICQHILSMEKAA